MTQTIFITGANRGLGLEFAKQYAEAGWQVMATCRDPNKADQLISLQQRHASVTILSLDVSDVQAITGLTQTLTRQPIDILLNNAGIFGPSGAHFGSVEAASWLQVLRVNTMAPLLIVQALWQNILLGQKKIIACISSSMGSIRGLSVGGRYPYRTSKAALNMVVKLMSIDLAAEQAICVALHPGWVQTGIGGVSATMKPQESVTYLRDILTRLTIQDSGKFFSYDGTEIPW